MLYEEEFRRVCGRLSEAARHLVHVEEVNLRSQVGSDAVFNLLDQMANEFRPTVFLNQHAADTHGHSASQAQFDNVLCWLKPTLSVRVGDAQLVVADSLTTCPCWATSMTTELQALLLWAQNGWQPFSKVTLHLEASLDPRTFFGSRFVPSTSDNDGGRAMLLVRCAALFYGQGRAVCLRSNASLEASLLLLPFCDLQHPVSP